MRMPLIGFPPLRTSRACFWSLGDLGLRLVDRLAVLVGVGVIDPADQAGPAEDDAEAMALPGRHDHLDVLDLADLLLEQLHLLGADLGGRAAGAAVGDDVALDGAEVGPCGHVAGPQVHAHADDLHDAAADLDHARVIAEQPQVRRPAAGRDAVVDGDRATQGALGCQRVQVRGLGLFQWRAVSILGGPDVAQAVQHQQHELLAALPDFAPLDQLLGDLQ